MIIKFYKKTISRGISVVEIIVASAIISLSMIYITNVYSNLLNLSFNNIEKVQTVFLLDEGFEALKTIRNYSWSSISDLDKNNQYYLIWENSRWQATTTPVLIDNKFIRKFTISDVYTDINTLNIVDNSSANSFVNNDIKIINLNVSWNNKNSTSSKETSFYVFNLYE